MDTSPTEAPLHILHLEDSAHDHRLVCRALDKAGIRYTITRVETLGEFSEQAASGAFELILADYRLPGFTAVDAWSALPADGHRPPFILLSGAIGEAAAVSAIHLGISDYLHKDDLSRLERVIMRSLDVYRAQRAKEKADRELAVSERRLSELTGYLQTAIERERASIAREIHDDIGGSLAAAKLDLAWLSRHSGDPAMQAHMQAATDMLQHALGASQRIMMSLRPSILDQGLFAAVQWLASSFERRTGIKTILRANTETLCPEKSVQLTAYRTAQEALTNISKYAQCSLVQIDISDAENFLTMEISDNGIGISEQEMLKPTAFGIRGLHERAKTVGGWLDVSTRQGSGTSIILSVPLTANGQLSAEAQFK
jgi:two-component system, NarL family, sensor histidine kinase UhpB